MEDQSSRDLLIEIATISRRTETALNRHVDDEARRLEAIDGRIEQHGKDIGEIKQRQALIIQRNNWINAAVATFIAAVVSWFANHFGAKG